MPWQSSIFLSVTVLQKTYAFHSTAQKEKEFSRPDSLGDQIHRSRPGRNQGEGAAVSSRRELNLFRREEVTILAGRNEISVQILPRYFT